MLFVAIKHLCLLRPSLCYWLFASCLQGYTFWIYLLSNKLPNHKIYLWRIHMSEYSNLSQFHELLQRSHLNPRICVYGGFRYCFPVVVNAICMYSTFTECNWFYKFRRDGKIRRYIHISNSSECWFYQCPSLCTIILYLVNIAFEKPRSNVGIYLIQT